MNDEQFLAYSRDDTDVVGRRGGGVKLEVGFTHDFAADVDERNHWSDSDAPDTRIHDELISIAARGLSELSRFVFDKKLHPNGRGFGEARRQIFRSLLRITPRALSGDRW